MYFLKKFEEICTKSYDISTTYTSLYKFLQKLHPHGVLWPNFLFELLFKRVTERVFQCCLDSRQLFSCLGINTHSSKSLKWSRFLSSKMIWRSRESTAFYPKLEVHRGWSHLLTTPSKNHEIGVKMEKTKGWSYLRRIAKYSESSASALSAGIGRAESARRKYIFRLLLA